jgi:uncharacterized membrane protein YgdD (TMEM256/DUF423 family)
MPQNKIAFIACVSLASAILLGAWNAHGMENFVTHGSIDAKYLKTFHTGVLYQFFNSLGMLILGLNIRPGIKILRYGIWLIFSGMCIFSFSLYLLSFHQMLGPEFKILGAITPIGGLLMAVGWIFSAFGFIAKKHA